MYVMYYISIHANYIHVHVHVNGYAHVRTCTWKYMCIKKSEESKGPGIEVKITACPQIIDWW